MKTAIVVAVGQKGEIGAKGDLLWRLPKDMKYFRDVTMGHHVLMGRKTWESLPPKYRPLDGRTNLVITRNADFSDIGCITFPNVEKAVSFAREKGEEVLMVIGGGEIFRQTFATTDILYLTRVHQSFPDADTFFPEVNPSEWNEVWREDHPADDRHAYPYSFIKLERKK